MAQTVRKMKSDKVMYLPTMTEDEFAENIGKKDFFRRFGNPAVIRTQAGEASTVSNARGSIGGQPSHPPFRPCSHILP